MNLGFSLDKDETIIRKVNRHWIALAPVVVATVVVVAIIIGLAYMLSRYRDSLPHSVGTGEIAGVLAALIALATLMLLGGVWVYRRNFLVLTNRHLIRVEQRGLFTRSVAQLSLSRVQDVSGTTSGFLATVLGYGNITVETAGEEENFVLTMVPRPAEVADKCLAAHDRFAPIVAGSTDSL